jgi:hypothetical protein
MLKENTALSPDHKIHNDLKPYYPGKNNYILVLWKDCLCGLVVRVLGYRSRGLGSVPGTTRKKISIGSETGSTHPREYN